MKNRTRAELMLGTSDKSRAQTRRTRQETVTLFLDDN